MDLYVVYIIITAVLVAVCCSLVGSLLVLRKMAMVSDAISHAVLPGIVAAYLISGTRDNVLVLVGAMVAGLFSTALIDFLHKRAGLQADASIGVTFTWLFALGVIMLSAYAGQVDLDQDCVLYGEIALVPFDLVLDGNGLEYGPRVAWIMASVLIIILTIMILFRRQLLITSFDPSFAAIIGVKNAWWNQIIMAMVSITTIAAFDAVGAILVVALMVVPPAAAYLLTKRLNQMLLLAVIFACLAAVLGYYLAALSNSSIAGCMAIVAGIELAGSTLWTKISQRQ
jgi:manganese/zinc/iron transport system permease protein